MKRIIYTQDNGIVAILVPSPEFIALHSSIDEAMEALLAKDVPPGKQAEIVYAAAVTGDRTFRNAWVKDGKTIKTDILKAKLIAHDKRRAKRAAELAPLDIEAAIPAKANQAEAARQAIRDKHAALQTAIDAATTEAALKQLLVDAAAL